ncbi:hypothetical protein T484DRAFT_1638639, partial [Baffinella frigidus]
IYSFGILVWEMLARELPFDAMTLKQATTRNPKPDIQNPTPHALRPTPYALRPTPCTLQPFDDMKLQQATRALRPTTILFVYYSRYRS